MEGKRRWRRTLEDVATSHEYLSLLRLEGRKDSLTEASGGIKPANTLISGFWLPELEENKFLLS